MRLRHYTRPVDEEVAGRRCKELLGLRAQASFAAVRA